MLANKPINTAGQPGDAMCFKCPVCGERAKALPEDSDPNTYGVICTNPRCNRLMEKLRFSYEMALNGKLIDPETGKERYYG